VHQLYQDALGMMPSVLTLILSLHYQIATGVPNVTTVPIVSKMTKNDHSVPIFRSVLFCIAFWETIISPLKFKTANSRHIENHFWPYFFVVLLHLGPLRAAVFVSSPIHLLDKKYNWMCMQFSALSWSSIETVRCFVVECRHNYCLHRMLLQEIWCHLVM